MKVDIRGAGPSHVMGIAQLESSLGRREWDESGVQGTLDRPANGAYVVFVAGQQVGHLIYSHVVDECEILTVAVKAECRRKGLASALIEQTAKSTGAHTLHLEVRETNAEARSLYRKLGFVDVGRRRAYYRNGEDAIVMKASFDVVGAGT